MRKFSKIRLLFLAALLGAMLLSLAGCGSKEPAAGPEPGQSEEKTVYEIRIPDMYTPVDTYIPYIAAAKGFYEAEGIKPVFTGVIGPGQHVAAVVAGDNDVGFLHINRTINGIAAGAKVRAVVAGSETSEEYPHMEYVVLENSPLKEPKDIIGKKVGVIAVGGCNEYTPYGILKKLGVDNPQDKIEIVVVPPGNEETALRTGVVDVVGFHGHQLDVFAKGGVRVLFDDYDVWGTVGGATPWYFREDFIEKNPEAIRRFVSAHAKAGNWVNEHREEAKKIQAEWTKVPVESVIVQNFAKDGIIKEDSIQLWIDELTAYGELKVGVPVKTTYTNEFNEFSPDYKFK
ncbi:MAG TPA: ABC transporter substrate-binding protein [Negativicutes bacterium]|nr:ABC transporter substrate-binding protein [Negativicutes bacterium]